MSDLVLVLNCGSSSIKFALFDAGVQPLPRQPLWNGKVDGISGPAPTFGETGVAPGPLALDAARPYNAALRHIRARVLARPGLGGLMGRRRTCHGRRFRRCRRDSARASLALPGDASPRCTETRAATNARPRARRRGARRALGRRP